MLYRIGEVNLDKSKLSRGAKLGVTVGIESGLMSCERIINGTLF